MKVKAQLKDIVSYSKGSQINGDELLDDGKYDYLNGGVLPSGKWNEYNTEAETVTVSEGGNSCGFVNYMQKPFWCGAHCYYLYDSKVNTRYLYYILKSQQDRLMKIRSGACMPNIKKSDLGKFEVIYDTDSNEQKKVIDVLDRISSIITARQQQLQKLDELVKARFVEMFGDAFDNSMNWPTMQLQEVVSDDCSVSYGIVQTGEEQDEGVPVFRPVDIVNNVPKIEELKKTTKEISDKYKRTILKGREMLITVRANIADTYIIGGEFAGCNVGRGIVPIRTNEEIMILEFLKHQIDSKHLNNEIKKLAKGIALIQLNMEDLRAVRLIVPPLKLQKQFVEFTKQLDKSKFVVQQALEKAQLLFDSLMQQYFG